MKARLVLRAMLLVSASLHVVCLQPVAAQQFRGVKMRLEPISLRGRSAAPVAVRIRLEYNEPQLLEGNLVLEVYDGVVHPEQLIATVRYEGIVLQGTDYEMQTVLPPLKHSAIKLYQIVGWLDTDKGRLSLSRDPTDPAEPHELISVGEHERALLTASVSGNRIWQQAQGVQVVLNKLLSPIQYMNGQERSSTEPRQLLHHTFNWRAYDLPHDPLQLCAFDVILLCEGALGRLEKPQLQALTTWVRAGGSLCVHPDGTPLSQPHLRFLRELFENRANSDKRLELGADGRLVIISPQADPAILSFPGLGRAALLSGDTDLQTTAGGETAPQVAAHLWKARSTGELTSDGRWRPEAGFATDFGERIRLIQRNGRLYLKRQNSNHLEGPFPDAQSALTYSGLSTDVSPSFNPLAESAVQLLLPKGIGVVPVWVIVSLLTAYVLTIGPIDYFVLGWLRARKYTWVLFPIVTAGYTALTMSITSMYMSSTETGGHLRVIDIVDDGVPIRQTELRMYFLGSQAAIRSSHTNAFCVPLQKHSANIDDQVPVPRNYSLVQAHYTGRFPQNYSLMQQVRQWDPRITRSFSIAPPGEDLPNIPWDDLSLLSTQSGRDRLHSLLKEAYPDEVRVDAVVLNQRRMYSVGAESDSLFSSANLTEGQRWVGRRNGAVWRSRRYREAPDREAMLATGILEASRRTRATDFFRLVSQVSPQGSDMLEDLPLLNTAAPNEWLLVIVVRKDQQITVYRRLIRAPAPKSNLQPVKQRTNRDSKS